MTFGPLKFGYNRDDRHNSRHSFSPGRGNVCRRIPVRLLVLFGSGRRSRRTRYTSRPRRNGTRGSSAFTDDRKKGPQYYDEAEE
jgi:hypothetical protein